MSTKNELLAQLAANDDAIAMAAVNGADTAAKRKASTKAVIQQWLDDTAANEADGEEWLEQQEEADEEEEQHHTVDPKYRAGYEKTKSAKGKSSLDNADPIAKLLRGLDPSVVCGLADQVYGVPRGTHAAKYSHLNQGMQRMNSGNRIRGAIARGEMSETDFTTLALG